MRKQHHQGEEPSITLHLWNYAQAVKAMPYLRAIVQALRERWLEVRRARLQLRRMDARPGRHDRHALIVRAEAARELEEAQGDFEQTLRELNGLDVYSFDPVQGVALIPFAQGENLAWFVFELFAPQGLEAWRFHADPLETRRPLAQNQGNVVAHLFAQGVNDAPHHHPR